MLPDDYLIHGDPKLVAAFLGITTRTLRRYEADPFNMPEMAKKLLRLRAEGDLRALGGDDWEGFYMGRDGLLYMPGWLNGWTPHDLRALFFQMQELAALRVEVRDLRLEVKKPEQVRLRVVK